MTLSAICVASLLSAAPPVVTKEATGAAAIVGENEANALREATHDALRNAVEQVAGVLVSADTLTKNSQLIHDRIYAKTQGYVRKYEVLSQKREKNTMLVTVRAEVGAADLDKDLQAVQRLVSELSRRRVMIVTHESSIDEKGVTTKSEVLASELTAAFKKDGWTIIDEKFGDDVEVHSGVAVGQLQAKKIQQLKSKAEYLLYGTANFKYHAPSQGGLIPEVDDKGQQLVFAVTGEYDFTLFDTQTGTQIAKIVGKFDTGELLPNMPPSPAKQLAVAKKASVSYERTAHDVSVNHAPKVIQKVRKALVEHLSQAELLGQRVVMSVTGLPDFRAVQDFRQAVKALSNVKDVTAGTLSGGRAEFDVTYAGSTEAFASALSSASFKKKRLSVTGYTASSVEVVVAK